MRIAWTTVSTRPEAERLAAEIIDSRLAACVQVEGPIRSFYRWEEKTESSEEFRLCIKCVPETLSALEKHVLARHPYDTPEWIVVTADQVAEKYLSWAKATSSPSPL